MKTLIYNGKIRINSKTYVTAAGFDSLSGKIIYTGSDLNVSKKDYDEIIDLKDKLVIPSFIESHCHFYKGSLMKKEINLKTAHFKKDFLNELIKFKNYLKPNEWLIGGYFSESVFKENFEVNKELIDEVCSDIPVFLFRTDLHSAVVNSKVIETTGLKGKINKFGNERIITRDNGDLTGEIKEQAYYYVMSFFPKIEDKKIQSAISDEISCLHKLGINSISDITLKEEFFIYKKLIEDLNEFDLDINCILPFEEYHDFSSFKIFSNKVRTGTFKAFYDGALSSLTAYFYDYYKNTCSNGMRSEFVESGEFQRLGIEIDKSGFQMAVHGIGDKSVSEIIDFVKHLEQKNGKRDRRFRLEHAQHILPADLARFKEYGIVTSVQPSHIYFDAKVAVSFLEDTETTHSYKNLIDLNCKVCFGTDFPVAGENPFETIYYAMTRNAEGFQNGFLPELSLNLDQCIDSYTINSAYANFSENEYGTIEIGKLANLIVLEQDLYKLNPDEIKEQKIAINFYRGKQIV